MSNSFISRSIRRRQLDVETLEPRTLLSSLLVFSKTAAFRHDSIPDAIAAIQQMGAETGFQVDATEDSGAFTDDNLSQYQAVVFLLTTGTVLDANQKDAFQRFIEAGNGYVGVHSASDTEYDWPWYGQLMGAYFSNHPNIQPAEIDVEDHDHPSTQGLPDVWPRTDEWYNFRTNPRDNVNVLATLDESTYTGGEMGGDHPIMWYHDFDGGRAWYTGMGHTRESYSEKLFLGSLLGGIEYAMGTDGSAPAAPHRLQPSHKLVKVPSARGTDSQAGALVAGNSHNHHDLLSTSLTADAFLAATPASDRLPSGHLSHALAGMPGFFSQGHPMVDGSSAHASYSGGAGPMHAVAAVSLPGWHKPG